MHDDIHNNALDDTRDDDANPALTETLLRQFLCGLLPSERPPCPDFTLPLSSVAPAPVSWLWPGVLPLGKLSLIIGDPGVGQSLLACDIAARASRAAEWPVALTDTDPAPFPAAPCATLFFAPDDHDADTLVPRLIAAGADLSLLHTIDADALNEHEPLSMHAVAAAAATHLSAHPETRLVVIDPFAIGALKDPHVRESLNYFADLARRHDVAVLVLVRAHARVALALSAPTTLPRSVWRLARDPADPAARLLIPVKTNLAPDTRALRFRIDASRIAWDAESIDAATIRAHDAPARTGPDSGQLARASALLVHALAAGPRPSVEIERLAAGQGVALRTVQRAKAHLAIASIKSPGGWLCALPAHLSCEQHTAPPGVPASAA